MFSVRTPGVLVFDRRDRCHAAVTRLATLPTEEGTLQEFGVQPIRPLVDARGAPHCARGIARDV
jgi:hypothetical protein